MTRSPNYMLDDFLGVLIAFILFSAIMIFPGYVAGYSFDLFGFKKRRSVVQFGIALILSASISPILFFLAYRLVSGIFTLALLLFFAVTFTIIVSRTRGIPRLFKEINQSWFAKAGVVVVGLWVIFSAILLIDLQWGNRIYYNIVAYDYATRVSVINAITRSGVPPVNPSFYPGTPQLLTSLYYFWYVLCSLIDQVGGNLVDARTSLMASTTWTGLALLATIALFVRLRSPDDSGDIPWRKAWIGIGLALVSGLDIFPGTFYMFFPKLLVGRVIEGDIEHWNEQITAWIGAITWAPHHVISLLACLLAWFLTQSSEGESLPRRLGTSLIAGLALASAIGLSVWIMFIFVVFWGVWGIARLIRRESIFNLWTMLLPGLVAGLAILPFVVDLFTGGAGGSTTNQFPFTISPRLFYPLNIISVYFPSFDMMPLHVLAIPLNYFMELGFFFIAGVLWFRVCMQTQQKINPFARQEVILFFVTAIQVTFLRSTVIANNDFGWRGWLFGQFILILWGVDVIQYFWNSNTPAYLTLFGKPRLTGKIRSLLSTLFTIGVLTSLYDAVLLRVWAPLVDTGIAGFPRLITPDNHLGERTFAARDAFTFMEYNLPQNTIVQFSPGSIFDRPSGLYRTRTTVIAYHTLYGVPESGYKPLIEGVGGIFDEKNRDWNSLDSLCKQYHIDILILRDMDPIWSNLDILKSARTPIYENRYFALFKCSGSGS